MPLQFPKVAQRNTNHQRQGHEITRKTKALYSQSLNANTNGGLISE